MSRIDYSNLAKKLTDTYTKQCIEQAQKELQNLPEFKNALERGAISSIISLSSCLKRYKDPTALDTVLDTIDLTKIYAGLEEREKKQKEAKEKKGRDQNDQKEQSDDEKLGYEDFLVLETLRYFREDFFKWVDKPKCPVCTDSVNVTLVNASRFPKGVPNPDEISIIENYNCNTCDTKVEFKRLNNPVSLLKTRSGRCGEWVNCFLLILHALIQPNQNRLRYIWNAEDHVWCEYYSLLLKRWIHLDPCENAFDNPHLYCDNWGKKMSLVIGINDGYIVDLSLKYITEDKRIEKSLSDSTLTRLINFVNYEKLIRYYNDYIQTTAVEEKLSALYSQVIVIRNQEKLDIKGKEKPTKTDVPKGRQSGSAEWTSSRGEGGSS